MEIVKRLVVASSVVGRRDEQVEPRGFYSKEAILYKTCHYTFVPIFIECRTPREWQPTSVLLPGEFHGQRSRTRLQSMESQRVGHDCATNFNFRTPRVGPNVKYGLWVIMMCHCSFIVTNVPLWWGMLIVG